MELTNRLDIPAPIYEAELRDVQSYKRRSDISITELISPPRVVALRRRHEAELIEDVVDRMRAFQGKAIHLYLEHHTSGMKEVYLRMKVHDWIVSGRGDRYFKDGDEWVLDDYKYCNPYAARGGPKIEWVEQLNLLRVLFEANRLPVDRLQVTTIYNAWDADNREWKDYPQKPAEVLPIPMWALAEARDIFGNLVEAHRLAQESELPHCSPEDRWFGWDKKLKREVSKRCNKFCNVRSFCEQVGDGQAY